MKMLTLDKFEEASEKVKEVTLETKLVNNAAETKSARNLFMVVCNRRPRI